MHQYDDRKAFNALDDVILCCAADLHKPWEARRNTIMKN